MNERLANDIHLIGIYGLYNFGCEAIVRGTYYLLKKANNNCNIYLHSYNSSLDKSIIKDLDIRILPIKRKKLNYLLWKINVFLKEHKSNYQISSENYIEKKDSVFLSIGGDIYTIPEKFWNDENYFAYNDLITKGEEILKRYKLIIWGASIGPFGKSLRINNYYFSHLKKIDYIFVRENLSYNYLKENFINNLSVINDPAFYVPSSDIPNTNEFIGMNFSPLSIGEMASDNIKLEIINAVKQVCKKYKRQILFIPHVLSKNNVNDDDYRFLINLRNSMPDDFKKNIIIANNKNFLDTKIYLKKCKIVIAARMHCAVNAICEGIPTIFLCYSQKGFGMAENIYGNKEFAIKLDEIELQLDQKIQILLDNYNYYKLIIENKLKNIRGQEEGLIDLIREKIMENS